MEKNLFRHAAAAFLALVVAACLAALATAQIEPGPRRYAILAAFVAGLAVCEARDRLRPVLRPPPDDGDDGRDDDRDDGEFASAAVR